MNNLINSLAIFENWNIPEILSCGTIGLGFLLAFLAYSIIRREQEREGSVRKKILNSCYIFMFFSIILVGLGFLSEKLKLIDHIEPQNTPNERTKLTLIGSGTVCRFLQTKTKTVLDNLKTNDKIDVEMFSGPSKTSLNLLLDMGVDGNKFSEFIALSSTRKDDNDLLNKSEWARFKKGDDNKKLVAIKIFNDPLQLGVRSTDKLKIQQLKEKQIIDTVLFELIKNNISYNLDIFCTSCESGTVDTYENIFKNVDNSFDWPSETQFYASLATKEMILQNVKPFIFLGSENYDLSGTESIKVICSNGIPAEKELFLYFIVTKSEFNYGTKDGDGYYEIKGEKGKLIIELKRHFDINYNNTTDVYKIENITGKNVLFVDII